MLNRVKFVFGLAIGLSFMAGMVLPGLFSVSSSVCPLRTSAQTNPCLAQEGTISAQHSALLQASLDAISYQATFTALRANPGTAATSIPSKNVAFADNFVNNKRGWDLTAKSNGSASLSQGTLALNLTKGLIFAEPIPGLIPDEFYLELDITIRNGAQNTSVGYYIGDANGQLTALTLKSHYVAFSTTWSFIVYQMDGTHLTVVSAVPIDKPLWSDGKSVRVGLNASGGSYSLYWGGAVVASTQIVGASKEVGLVAIEDGGDFGASLVAAFGKLVVQPALKS